MSATEKTCTKCGETKSLDAFFPRGDGRGVRSHCKACLRRTDEHRARRRALHAASPERHTRDCMIQRCHNPNNPGFVDYGARGIVVCDRWRESFEAFLADMGPRPTAGHTIERENNDGPYAPDNCRWATRAEQNRNTRQNVDLTIDGRTMCVAEWAREAGVEEGLIRDRLRLGWAEREAVFAPARRMRGPVRIGEEEHTVAEWSRRSGIPVSAIYSRLSAGWTPADAVSKPAMRGAA